MAKKEITLTAEQWAVVFNTVRSAPAGRDVETQYRQYQLMESLRGALVDGQTTIGLLGWQRTMVDSMLANPTTPWRVEGLSHIWTIREAFGWKRPQADDYDDEEGET